MNINRYCFVVLLVSAGCGSSNNNPTGDAGVDADVDIDGGQPPSPYKPGDKISGYEPGQCSVTPAAEPFEDPSTELHWRGDDLLFPEYEQSIVSPVVVDFIDPDPDNPTPEVVFVSYQSYSGGRGTGVLRIISGKAPYDTLMTFTGDGKNANDGTGTPSLLFDAHPSAGDLDGDGIPEIVAVKQNGGLVAFKNDGTEFWSVSVSDNETRNGSIAIADLNQDGNVEIIIGRTVRKGIDGTALWTGTQGRGDNSQGPLSCVADVKSDSPGLEVIAGNTVYSSTGAILWRATGVEEGGTVDGFCAVADVLDNTTGNAGRDGLPEVIRVADGKVYVHNTQHSGSNWPVLWMVSIPSCGGGAGAGGAPTVADFDGDGWMEIGVAGGTCYAVFDKACPGNSEKCASPSPETSILWKHTTDDSSSNVTSSTVFDFNGDGKAEVIYNDEQRFFVFNGEDGSEVYSNLNPSRTRTEQPVVADVDNDGNAEIVFVASNEASFAGDDYTGNGAERIPGIEIWSSGDDTWVGARPIWNQHTYHISNINLDATVPQEEEPSWTTHNTYRLNAPIGDALIAPDLGTEWGDSYCNDTSASICVQLLNYGDVHVGEGIKVRFFNGDPANGGTLLGEAVSKDPIAAGTAGESVCIPWENDTGTNLDVWAVIDPQGNTRECREDNNTMKFTAHTCKDFVF